MSAAPNDGADDPMDEVLGDLEQAERKIASEIDPGARAVVVRDVDERAIVAGNPARVIGSRAVEGRNRLKGRAPSEPEG